MPDERRRLFRNADWLKILIAVCTLFGVIYTAMAKPQKWDAMAEVVQRIEPIVYQTKNRQDVSEAHYEDILRRLESIDRKLGR